MTHDSEVATDGSWGGGQWVCSTEEGYRTVSNGSFQRKSVAAIRTSASLDGITSLPNHCANWPAQHI